MKIGYFTSNYLEGSSETYVVKNIAERMTSKGHKIYIYTSSKKEKKTRPKSNLIIYGCGQQGKLWKGKTPISLKLFLKPLKQDFDLIQGFLGTPLAFYSSTLYSIVKDKPLLFFYHHDWRPDWRFSEPSLIRKFLIYLSREIFKKSSNLSDVILLPSEEYIKESNILNESQKNTVVTPNGIDLKKSSTSLSKEKCRNKLGISDFNHVLLFVGALSVRKGVNYLIRAMKDITKNHNVKLLIAGQGPKKEELKKLTKKMDLEKNVRFEGYIKEKIKPIYYKAADIFILPSLEEGFGIVNLEAWACSTPVIASRVGGVPAVVESGKTGLLVEPGNSADLAKKINHLLKNEDMRSKMGRKGREEVKKYRWRNICNKLEKLYKKLVTENG